MKIPLTVETWIAYILAIFLFPAYVFAADETSSSFMELEKSFPGSVHLKITGSSSSFEFCPDNTCDLIVSRKAVSGADISDLGFLYLRYFSDYFVLEDWRKNDVTRTIAENILVRHEHLICMKNDRREMARCVLDRARRKFGLMVYAVRYDEGGRHLVRRKLP